MLLVAEALMKYTEIRSITHLHIRGIKGCLTEERKAVAAASAVFSME